MKILILSFDVPAASSMPGSPRLFNLCRHLSAQHRLTLVTPSESPERLEAFRSHPLTNSVFERTIIVPNPPAPRWWGNQLHRLRQEVHFGTRYRNPQYHAAQSRHIRDVFVDGGFDVVYVDAVPMAQYVMDSGLHPPAIIDLHDCGTLLLVRTASHERNWLRKFKYYLETRTMAKYERSLSGTFSTVITNSPVDEAYLKSIAPATNTLTIGNGVDTAFFSPAQSDGDPRHLVFTGVMAYGPNADAAIHFAENILPLIQRRYPDAEFWVVGEGPPDRVRRLGERQGVHVTGGVPDVRPYVGRAGIFVCPLRYGTGVKNKLLAALAMQKPVVATRRSLDGLLLREDEHLLVADEPEEFAAKVIRLIEEPGHARRLASSGRVFVGEQYSWESSARALEAVLLGAVRAAKNGR